MLKIIFAGTTHFSAYHLNALINSKYLVIGVLTQPDRYNKRGKKITSNPVKTLAKKYNIPLFQPNTMINQYSKELIQNLQPDIIIVIAYGLILPKNILNIPKLGCINVHASLLPRWRGAAPIQHAILAGDKETGITIIKMDEGIDTGNILNQEKIPIEINDTTETISFKLSQLGKKCLLNTLEKIKINKINQKKQNNTQATYAKKIKKEEGKLNWKRSAIELERSIRAFNPKPTSFFYINSKIIKVWKANILKQEETKPGEILQADKNGIKISTKKGILNLLYLQEENKKSMPVSDFLNSRHKWFKTGSILE